MRVKKLLVMALLVCPMAGMAQSTYEQIGDSAKTTQVENKKVSAAFQQWLGQYEECGRKINEVSEQYQREVDKRGYPKKKTVQAKMALVDQYISLLKQERFPRIQPFCLRGSLIVLSRLWSAGLFSFLSLPQSKAGHLSMKYCRSRKVRRPYSFRREESGRVYRPAVQ